jgi:hypothetical protein
VRWKLRRSLRQLDRQTPEWMGWLTPWGTSIALHALVLLILAVAVLAQSAKRDDSDALIGFRFVEQLRDDSTSLTNADQSGDPFTTEKSELPPSHSTDPSEDATAINAPELRPGSTIGDALFADSSIGRPISAVLNLDSRSGVLAAPAELAAPFSGRQGPAKARLIRREGGSVESERAVELGLDWIVRHQRSDGSWSLDHKPQCRGKGCPTDAHADADTAATGLALLPLLGAGLRPDEASRHQEAITKGLNWLLKQQKPDGDLFTGGGDNTQMYSHAIATMALCESYGITGDKRLRDAAQRAVNFIVSAQNHENGGWRYHPGEAGDTSVLGWQMFALRSAHLAKLKVDDAAVKGAMKYLDAAATNETKTKYAYVPHQGATPVMTAEALLVRQYLGWTRDMPAMKRGSQLVYEHLMKSKDRNIYYWYYATQLLHNMQGNEWRKWNIRVRDGLVTMQVTGDGCDRGSWDPNRPVGDAWGHQVGRHFVTTLSLLTLEVYYRYLPLYRSRESELVNPKDLVKDDVKEEQDRQ